MERQKSPSIQRFIVESHDDYHATPDVGSSGIRLADECPEKFHYRYLSGQYEEKTTSAKEFGRLMHMALLEPERTRERIKVGPANAPRNTNAGKEKWAVFHATLKPDDIVMDAKDADVIVPMINRLVRDESVKKIISGGIAERSGYFLDERTNVPCKFRPDTIIITPDMFFISDYKTTTDASYEGFQRSIHKYGYDVQAAHYLAGGEALLGTKGIFTWIAQEKAQPCVVGIYVATRELLDIGEYRRRRGLAKIKLCRESGIWGAYADGPVNMAPAKWAEWQQLENEEGDVYAQ